MATLPSNQRPIIIRKIKKQAHAHHGGAWKVAYADFVTAMMAFFMLLWLISNPDKQRLKGLAEYFSPAAPSSDASSSAGDTPGETIGSGGRSVRATANSQNTTGKPSIDIATAGVARGGSANVPDPSLRVVAQELKVAVDTMPDPTQARQSVKLESDPQGLRISLMDSSNRSMFKGGTAQLNDYARELLEHIALKLVKSGAQLSIEGHTDATGGQSDSNWRLSGERALSARAAMIGAGLTPDRFGEVVAKAATQPVYPDQPNRPENRRITIVVMGSPPALPTDSSFKF